MDDTELTVGSNRRATDVTMSLQMMIDIFSNKITK